MSDSVPNSGVNPSAQVGAVVIGRNEGERLKGCLRSMIDQVTKIVYVDSGSTDDSVAFAKSLGVLVVDLDTSIPFSAGRARNEGFTALREALPDVDYVQFVDGDCELISEWLPAAVRFLDENSEVAVVCGQRKERYPEASVYNRLCDIEWNTPVGKAQACGGDFLSRARAFAGVNGFNPSVVAGEEPEMCFRLREKGWQIWRIDQVMTMHDAQMTRLKQWWLRAKRCGHAYAQGESLHGNSPEQYYRREVKSTLLWGPVLLLAPVGILLGLLGMPYITIILLCLPAVLYLKVLKYSLLDKKLGLVEALVFAFFIVLAKLPELIGIITFNRRSRNNQRPSIIEYK